MRTKTLFLLMTMALIVTSGCEKDGPEENPSHTKHYSAEVAVEWYKLLTEMTRTKPYVPPPTTRIFAYTGLALYESVLPGMPSYKSMLEQLSGQTIVYDKHKEYYWPAAANAALSQIAQKLVSIYPSPNTTPMKELEASFETRFAQQIDAEKLQNSIAFGKLVADAVYEWSKTDGTLTPNGTLTPCPPYVPVGGPGNWVPTPPGFLPGSGACQGKLRTFIPNVVTELRPPAPPAYTTDPGSAFYKMGEEVYTTTINATTEEKRISEAWRDLIGTNYNTPAHILHLTADIMVKEKTNLEEASLIFAQQGMAIFDAIATAVGAKFHYSILRPITYIQNVLGHKSFTTQYPTPQHPSYPAVAPAAAHAALVIMEDAWGKNYAFEDKTQESLYGTWNFNSFAALGEHVAISRTHSGLNFKFAVEAGAKVGKEVGNRVLQMRFRNN